MDEQYLKEFAETVKRAQDEIQKYGAVTAETAAQLERQQQVQAALIKKSQATSIIFGTMGSAAADLTKSLYSGAEGAQSLANSLKIVTDAGGELVSTLSVLIKNPVWRGVVFALGQLTKFAGNFIQETSKVSDDLYSNFYKLADVGLATQEGMTGFASRLLELNYGLNEMDKAVTLLSRDTRGLATVGGSVENGAKALGQFAASMRTSPVYKEMYRLYGNYDTINKKLVDYLSMQARLGAGTTASIAEFQRMTLQTEALTRAFGVQTEELDKINRKNLAETAFRSVVDDIRASQGEAYAKSVQDQISLIETKFGPEIAQGFKAGLAGNISDPEFQKIFRVFPEAGEMFQKVVNNQGESVLGLAAKIGKAGDEATRGLGDLAKVAPQAVDEFGGRLAVFRDILAEGDLEGRFKAEQKAIEDQIKKGLDPATEAQIKMRHSQNDARDSLQQLVKLGVTPTTKALAGLAKTINSITGEVVDTGGADLGAGPGAARTETGEFKARGGTYGSTASGGTGGFQFSKEGVLGKIENFITQGQGFRANYGRGVDDVINFGNNTGSRKHFDQLNDTVREAFINMAIEYNSLTGGKKLSVNSAFRSEEEQAATNSGGRPKAAPGQSLHQRGLAVDINTAESQFLKQQGLLDKYGFLNDIPGDAPHIYMKGPEKKEGFADGGISDGPTSGYMALLHGLEAIVPLANNRSIPVSFREPELKSLSPDISFGQDLPEINEAINRQSQVMEQQLQKSEAMLQALNQFATADLMKTVVDKLQNLNDKMSTTNDISSRILQVQM